MRAVVNAGEQQRRGEKCKQDATIKATRETKRAQSRVKRGMGRDAGGCLVVRGEDARWEKTVGESPGEWREGCSGFQAAVWASRGSEPRGFQVSPIEALQPVQEPTKTRDGPTVLGAKWGTPTGLELCLAVPSLSSDFSTSRLLGAPATFFGSAIGLCRLRDPHGYGYPKLQAPDAQPRHRLGHVGLARWVFVCKMHNSCHSARVGDQPAQIKPNPR